MEKNGQTVQKHQELTQINVSTARHCTTKSTTCQIREARRNNVHIFMATSRQLHSRNNTKDVTARYKMARGKTFQIQLHEGNTRWPAGPWPSFVSQNSEWPPFFPFWVGMGSFERSGGSKFRCGSQISSPFPGLTLPFFWVRNIRTGMCKKSYETPCGWTKNACCLRHGFTQMCFLYREK